MRLRWRRQRDLADRLRPYVAPAEAIEPMMDADPIRMFRFRWLIETGDPLEVVATGFGLDAQLITDLLDRTERGLSWSEFADVAEALGVSLLAGSCESTAARVRGSRPSSDKMNAEVPKLRR